MIWRLKHFVIHIHLLEVAFNNEYNIGMPSYVASCWQVHMPSLEYNLFTKCCIIQKIFVQNVVHSSDPLNVPLNVPLIGWSFMITYILKDFQGPKSERCGLKLELDSVTGGGAADLRTVWRRMSRRL